jgi:hypothetical protein
MDKITDEKKLLWMRDSLNKVNDHLNEKYQNTHTFGMVNIKFDGEAWEGYVQPFILIDTNRPWIDRVFMRRSYRTNTFRELMDQMCATVKFQDDWYNREQEKKT